MMEMELEAGAATGTQPEIKGFSLISCEKLLQLYRAMLKCRMLNERVNTLTKPNRRIEDRFPAAGHEAAVAGAVIDLLPEDTLVPSAHDLCAGFVKGVPLEEMFGQLLSSAASSDNGMRDLAQECYEPLNVLAAFPTNKARLDRATRIASENKTKGNCKVVVVFSGGVAASGSLRLDAVDFAGMKDLPIALVCHDPHAVGEGGPEPQAKAGDLSLKALASGIPCIPVDGNDVVAVYRVASEAFAHARKGCSPTIIECKTCGSPSLRGRGSAKARPQEGAKLQSANDPILAMESYLTGKGLFNESLRIEVTRQFSKELDEAIALAKKPRNPEYV